MFDLEFNYECEISHFAFLNAASLEVTSSVLVDYIDAVCKCQVYM